MSEHLNEKVDVAGLLQLHQHAEFTFAWVHNSPGNQISAVGETLD